MNYPQLSIFEKHARCIRNYPQPDTTVLATYMTSSGKENMANALPQQFYGIQSNSYSIFEQGTKDSPQGLCRIRSKLKSPHPKWR